MHKIHKSHQKELCQKTKKKGIHVNQKLLLFYKSTALSSNSKHSYSSSDKRKQPRTFFFSHLRPHLTIISVFGPQAKQNTAHSKNSFSHCHYGHCICNMR